MAIIDDCANLQLLFYGTIWFKREF